MSRPGKDDITPARAPSPVVLLTGATGGLGTAVAAQLARQGCRVGLCARNASALDGLAQELEEAGAQVLPLPADATSPQDAAAAVERLVKHFGRIDCLIDNAGVEGPVGPSWEVPLDAWWQTMHTNVMSTVATVHAVMACFVRQHSGRIISISSEAGRHRWPSLSAYSVSKAAGIKFIENLSHEARAHGVTALSVHPGIVTAGLTTTALHEQPPSVWHARRTQWLQEQLDQGKGVEAERAARAVVAVALGAADHRSGQFLTLDDIPDTPHPGPRLPAGPGSTRTQT
ncbi:SDR family NAD(P)-dependent oxidoreductase [Streptomyces sp. NPDC051561]|uniref:SDR family NAD(P)-dependent oxidoreductase n=1 Tax=Streptomyces sp. NPDC051561 TaxID=3365658 RepID=UPI00378BEC36